MKMNKNQPRNVDAHNGALQNLSLQVNNLKQEMNPVPRAISVSAQPGPIRSNSAVWISRRLRIVKQSSPTGGDVVITNGDLFKAIDGGALTGDAVVRVHGFKAWNVSNSSTNSNFLRVVPDTACFLTGANLESLQGPFEDYGGGGVNPRLGVNLPDIFAREITVVPSGAGAIFDITTSAVPVTSPQTIVCDLNVRVRV